MAKRPGNASPTLAARTAEMESLIKRILHHPNAGTGTLARVILERIEEEPQKYLDLDMLTSQRESAIADENKELRATALVGVAEFNHLEERTGQIHKPTRKPTVLLGRRNRSQFRAHCGTVITQGHPVVLDRTDPDDQRLALCKRCFPDGPAS